MTDSKRWRRRSLAIVAPIGSWVLVLLAGAFLRARVCTILTQMLAADAYRPDQWHDFFITVGGAAAAVTGLVFVALSLNLEVVTRDATHRYRAIGTLMNFAGIFVLCSLALMGGQNHVAIGAEWLIVASSACGVFVHGYLRARSGGGSQTNAEHAIVDVRLPHPSPDRLDPVAELTSDAIDGPVIRAELLAELTRQPDRVLFFVRRIPTRGRLPE